jgi:hypothetical protein
MIFHQNFSFERKFGGYVNFKLSKILSVVLPKMPSFSTAGLQIEVEQLSNVSSKYFFDCI